MESTFDDYGRLLDDWTKVPPQRSLVSPTFMEVMGYPHWENVWSNILAFFLNDSNEHEMKNLWAKSLIECAKEKVSSELVNQYEKGISNIDVIREYPTEKGNSIDILVSSDNYVIGIENKVCSPANNPFDDYAKTIQQKADVLQCTPIYILLSIRNEDKPHWLNVTYNRLFDQVLNNLGEYVENANEKWTICMKDFIKTGRNRIDLLTGGSNMVFDNNMIEFMKNNAERSSRFLKDMSKVKKEINRRVDTLKGEIENDISSIQQTLKEPSLRNVDSKIWAWHGEDSKDLIGGAVIDIKISNRNFVVEALFDYEWRVLLWDRNNDTCEENRVIRGKIEEMNEAVTMDDRGETKRSRLGKFNANVDYTQEVLNELRRGVKIIAKIVSNL